FSLQGDSLMIEDSAGNMATVVAADLMQSNGVVHVIDTVLMP
ncbi:MAG: putative surface protein with fasciclin (FAS1) repeats, partial [Marinobacter psychrophilus]